MAIAGVTLNNFRGVVGPLSISLRRTGSGEVRSLVLYGENGTGKSSVCDALEFATRGVVSRRLADGSKLRREIKNLSGTRLPSVDLELADGSLFARGYQSSGSRSNSAISLSRKQVVPGFELSPLVVRRSAIEAFWQIPPSKRQDFFWDYLRNPAVDYRTASDETAIAEHRAALRLLANARRDLQKLIPADFKLRNSERPYTLPNHSSGLRSLRQVAAAAKRQRHSGSLDSADERVLTNFRQSLKAEERLRPIAEAARSKVTRDLTLLQDVLGSIGPRVAADFGALSTQAWVKDVRFRFGPAGWLNIELARASGRPLNPEEVLSEAHLDLLALLALVEMHVECAERGQQKVIVLDDVFQSIDSPLRSAALAHLASRLRGWQILLTVHDRLWLELAKRSLTENGVAVLALELRHGGFGETPSVIGVNPGHMRDLRHAIEHNASAVVTAGIAGRTLEAICDELSTFLGAEVRRKPGDKYTIGDLWPSVKKMFEGSDDPELLELARLLDRTQFLRNIAGAHFTSAADGLTDAEALESATNIERIYNKFWCAQCDRQAKKSGTSRSWSLSFTCAH